MHKKKHFRDFSSASYAVCCDVPCVQFEKGQEEDRLARSNNDEELKKYSPNGLFLQLDLVRKKLILDKISTL